MVNVYNHARWRSSSARMENGADKQALLKDLVFHSDRGVQYACSEFSAGLYPKRVTQSMSRKGNCWDYAVAENFFKIIKSEAGDQNYKSVKEAKQELFEFIEIGFNRIWRHFSLGYLSPEQFGKTTKKAAA